MYGADEYGSSGCHDNFPMNRDGPVRYYRIWTRTLPANRFGSSRNIGCTMDAGTPPWPAAPIDDASAGAGGRPVGSDHRSEQVERPGRGRSGLGRVGDEHLAGRSGRGPGDVAEVDIAKFGMAQRLEPAGLLVDVVLGPQSAERLAAHGQVAHERGKLGMVGVLTRGHPQDPDGLAGRAFPVAVPGGELLVQEQQPSGIALALGQDGEVGEQSAREVVPADHLR